MGIQSLSWFGSGRAISFVCDVVREARECVRIASAYFSLASWHRVRKHIECREVKLLVGCEEREQEQVRELILSDLMEELCCWLEDGRRETIQDLLVRLKSGCAKIVDVRLLKQHAKIYIADRDIAIVGSANFTESGLLYQIEAGTVVTDKEQVEYLVSTFDEYFERGEELTSELCLVLERWLETYLPWLAYLRIVYLLRDEFKLEDLEVGYDQRPTAYQIDMIATIIRQLLEHRGSMVVATTGLGKTLVSIYVATYLHKHKYIDKVLIVSPKAVKQQWHNEFMKTNIPFIHVVTAALHIDRVIVEDVDKMENLFNAEQQRFRWLVIIDESHQLRNQPYEGIDRRPRRGYQRLRQFIEHVGAMVIWLSGSPYGKRSCDINNQLSLLPKAEGNGAGFWRVPLHLGDEAFIEKFVNLPVVCQVTSLYVARHYGQHDERGIYVMYGNQKRYIPGLNLHTVEFPLLLSEALDELLRYGYLQTTAKNTLFRHSIEKQACVAWCSSPEALENFMIRVLDTPGGPNSFEFSKVKWLYGDSKAIQGNLLTMTYEDEGSERQKLCQSVLDFIQSINPRHEPKLQILLHIIKEHLERGDKILIFTERRATAHYLEKQIKKFFPGYRVSSLIEKRTDNLGRIFYDFPRERDIKGMIRRFAPIANHSLVSEPEQIDILISTDAYGIGVNLQDARVVVNYDLCWTAIELIQRAGRVLRFWHEYRVLDFYTFIPKIKSDESAFGRINYRSANLISRHEIATKISHIPVLDIMGQEIDELPMTDRSYTVSTNFINVDELEIEVGGKNVVEQFCIEQTSRWFEHLNRLRYYESDVSALPNDIISVWEYSEELVRLVTLVKSEGKQKVLCYYFDGKDFCYEERSIIEILDLVQVDKDKEICDKVSIEWIDWGITQIIEDYRQRCKVKGKILRLVTVALIPIQQ